MQAERMIHYGKLTRRARKDLSSVLDRYQDQFVRITIEQLEEDTSDPVRMVIPENTRNRLKRARLQFNALRDKPVSTAQFINYLLDIEENRKQR